MTVLPKSYILGIPRRKAPRNDMTADQLDSDLVQKTPGNTYKSEENLIK